MHGQKRSMITFARLLPGADRRRSAQRSVHVSWWRCAIFVSHADTGRSAAGIRNWRSKRASAGRVALLLFCLIALLSLGRRALRFEYDHWRRSHALLATLGFLLAAGHLHGAGTLLETPNTFTVGRFGEGQFDVSGGAKAHTGSASIGAWDSGVGRATVTGRGSEWTMDDNAFIGAFGSGTFSGEKA